MGGLSGPKPADLALLNTPAAKSCLCKHPCAGGVVTASCPRPAPWATWLELWVIPPLAGQPRQSCFQTCFLETLALRLCVVQACVFIQGLVCSLGMAALTLLSKQC